MKSLIEFSIICSGNPTNFFTHQEVQIANALQDYAHQFINPQYDEGRIAGWVMAKTGINSRLQTNTWLGIGYDVSVSLVDVPGRTLLMKRKYLHWKKDLDHIANQWALLWDAPSLYRDSYLSLCTLPYHIKPETWVRTLGPARNTLVVDWNGKIVGFVAGSSGDCQIVKSELPFNPQDEHIALLNKVN